MTIEGATAATCGTTIPIEPVVDPYTDYARQLCFGQVIRGVYHAWFSFVEEDQLGTLFSRESLTPSFIFCDGCWALRDLCDLRFGPGALGSGTNGLFLSVVILAAIIARTQ